MVTYTFRTKPKGENNNWKTFNSPKAPTKRVKHPEMKQRKRIPGVETEETDSWGAETGADEAEETDSWGRNRGNGFLGGGNGRR